MVPNTHDCVENCPELRSVEVLAVYSKKGGWTQAVIQNEVRQMVKNKYHKITHICGIYKKGISDLIYKTETETQTWKTNIWTQRRGRGGEINIYILLTGTCV